MNILTIISCSCQKDLMKLEEASDKTAFSSFMSSDAARMVIKQLSSSSPGRQGGGELKL